MQARSISLCRIKWQCVQTFDEMFLGELYLAVGEFFLTAGPKEIDFHKSVHTFKRFTLILLRN